MTLEMCYEGRFHDGNSLMTLEMCYEGLDAVAYRQVLSLTEFDIHLLNGERFHRITFLSSLHPRRFPSISWRYTPVIMNINVSRSNGPLTVAL